MFEPNKYNLPAQEWIRRWLPALAPVSIGARLTSAAIAFVAILLLTAISFHFSGAGSVPFMIASMGASAVLLFAVPHSPLVHPWSFAGGHLVSALAGVLCALFVPNQLFSAALAVAGAILFMHTARCLHPPGGATALMPVLGGEAIRHAGFGFVLIPVGLNVLVLLILALALNNLLPGRSWPARPAPSLPARERLFREFGLTHGDLETVLREMNTVIDVDQADLENIYAQAMMHAQRRRLGEVRVADIMLRDVPSCVYGDDLETIWELMRVDRHKGVPVIDSARRVTGIVTIVDFLKRVEARKTGSPINRLAAFIRRTPGEESSKPEVVGQIMTSPVITVRDDAHVVSLIPLFAEHEIHHLPVVDAEQRLVGMVTQSELLSALHRRRSQPGRPASRAS